MDQPTLNWIKSLLQHNNTKAFYNSGAWKKVRAEVLEENNNECKRCKSEGLYSEAVTVHHIKYLRKHPELALDKDNLEAICDECHFIEHHSYVPKKQLNEEKW